MASTSSNQAAATPAPIMIDAAVAAAPAPSAAELARREFIMGFAGNPDAGPLSEEQKTQAVSRAEAAAMEIFVQVKYEWLLAADVRYEVDRQLWEMSKLTFLRRTLDTKLTTEQLPMPKAFPSPCLPTLFAGPSSSPAILSIR